MKSYQINYTGPNGATSAIDTVVAQDGYTAEQYIADCENNADEEWVEMLHNGDVEVIEIEDDDEESTVQKRVYVASHGDSDWVDDKITFDKAEAVKAAEMALYHLTDAEKKKCSVIVMAYDLDCYEDETAEDAYNRILLDDELPECVESFDFKEKE